MRVLLDEDVHVKLIDWLVSSGHDVARVPSGTKNGQVLALALQQNRILITRDKDFSNRLMYPPSRYLGIVVLRVHPPLLEKLISVLRRLLAEVQPEQFKGRVFLLEEEEYHVSH